MSSVISGNQRVNGVEGQVESFVLAAGATNQWHLCVFVSASSSAGFDPRVKKFERENIPEEETDPSKNRLLKKDKCFNRHKPISRSKCLLLSFFFFTKHVTERFTSSVF